MSSIAIRRSKTNEFKSLRRSNWSHGRGINPGASRNIGSKLGISGRSREWDHVADVAHTGDEQHGPLEAQAKTGMGHGPILAQIQIPPVCFDVKFLLAHALGKDVEPL